MTSTMQYSPGIRVEGIFAYNTVFYLTHAPVAQGIEHSFPKAGVAGSNPAGGVFGVNTLLFSFEN